jgi:hypothetical protein
MLRAEDGAKWFTAELVAWRGSIFRAKARLEHANRACLGGGGKGEYELLITNE